MGPLGGHVRPVGPPIRPRQGGTIASEGATGDPCDNPAMHVPPRERPSVARRLPLLLFVTLTLVACGTSSATPTGASLATPSPAISGGPGSPGPSSGTATASPSASPDDASVYAAIEAQVQELRGLKAKRPVDPKLLDEATLKTNIEASFLKANPPEQLAATQRIYELMGLVPAGTDLKSLYLELLASQVAGYYDDDTKELYVVSKSGGLGPTERVTFAHEFDHALQDQNLGLKSLNLDAVGQGDRSLAALAVPEGDATLLMTLWTQGNLTPQDLVQLIKDSSDPEQQKILAEMPPLLRESLTFPYTAGLQFVASARAAGGWAGVDALYKRPPASTEQVLHPDKYAAGEAPVAVSFPADLAKRLGSGWTVTTQDTLGEFVLRTWLANGGAVTPQVADTAAAGWGGDRIALVRNGERSGIVVDTRWDTVADAEEFAAAAGSTLDRLTDRHALIHLDGSDRVTLFVATDDATIEALAGALGLAG